MGVAGICMAETCGPPGPPDIPFSISDPPFWPKIKSIDFPGPPLGAAWAADRAPGTPLGAALAAEHAPGTPSGPSKNRSERKMELLILHGFYHQN